MSVRKNNTRLPQGHEVNSVPKPNQPPEQIPAYGKVTTAKELGGLVRRKRKEVGALQESTAAMSGVGTKFLSQVENGKETAELGKVLQVLKSLGLELYVFPRSENPLKDR
jgi:y4mF family transcriptional regulator